VLELDGLEPGPIVIDDMPFGPRVSREGLLESFAEPLVNTLHGSDDGLASSSDHVSRDVPRDLDAAYARSAGTAAEAHADQVTEGSGSQAGQLVDSGAGVEVYRGQVLPHLPPPTTGVDMNLVPPPKPPQQLLGVPSPPDLKDFS